MAVSKSFKKKTHKTRVSDKKNLLARANLYRLRCKTCSFLTIIRKTNKCIYCDYNKKILELKL